MTAGIAGGPSCQATMTRDNYMIAHFYIKAKEN
nr:MAG TPA: hypothetical protein [Bacteriophage sp.]